MGRALGQLSLHFWRHEFACKCGCGFNTVDAELIAVLERLRFEFGSAILINSGTRCPAHNALVGGATNSQHIVGKAADIVVRGHHENEVVGMMGLWYPRSYGVGRYIGRTHIDVRPLMARWDSRRTYIRAT